MTGKQKHFSTRVIIGKRPTLFTHESTETVIELATPLLVEGKAGFTCAESLGQPSFDQLVQHFQEQKLAAYISTTFKKEETVDQALIRLANEAVKAVESGKTLLVLDDAKAHQEDYYWMDPHLVTSAIDQALVKAELRRNSSLLVRSAAIRSLHDIITVFGLGADLISPYYMFFNHS
ncbi:hypothetical protein QFZ87_004376 [Bacillus sp. SLBN-46]|nr:hypothetical protein [Bacillus sp. SLBN-46]